MIRLLRSSFVRHIGIETLVWNPRNGGAVVVEYAKDIVDSITPKWKPLDDVADFAAQLLCCDKEAVQEDVNTICNELIKLGLAECDVEDVGTNSSAKGILAKGTLLNDESDAALDYFILRHKLLAELHIDITSACTERCVHCYLPGYPNKFLPFPAIEKVLQEFRQIQGLTVHLTGGECMMHPDFEKICHLCKDLDLNIILFSNLTCCDAKRIAALKAVDPQFINVSLYSMKAEEHDAITQVKGSWQKTMNAILACKKAGIHVRIATPLLKENMWAFRDLKKFADGQHMHLVPEFHIAPRSNQDCSNLNFACNQEELCNVLQQNKALFNQGWLGAPLPGVDDKVCDIGVSRLYLNSVGDYYPCDGMHGYVLGNVARNRLAEVWAGEKLNVLRSLTNKDFGECASCQNRKYCKVCPAYNFSATGDMLRHISAKCETAAAVRKVYGETL